MASKTETIDSRILRLIGLEDVFDLDYDTYFTLLKEALVKYSVIGKAKIPTEELELLRDELKRVRGKTGRFTPKTKKINVSSIPRLKLSNKTAKVSPLKLLKPSGYSPKEEEKSKKPQRKKDTLESLVASIKKSVDSIAKSLANLNSLTKKGLETDRRNAERSRRAKREEGMESDKPSLLGNIASAIIKPFENIFEKIFRFIFWTLLGNSFFRILDWFQDPENKEKVGSIFRFFKDWWPAIVGSYLLFGNSFGRMVTRMTFMIGKFIFKLTRFVIPKLVTFAAKNPVAALAIAGGVGAFAASQMNKNKREGVTPEETAETGKTPGGAQLQREQILQRGAGGMFSGGGRVPGYGSGDTVPAMLTPGEFVMSKGAVSAFGADTFASMNAAGGGTNSPKFSGGITYAQGGGYIGKPIETKNEKPPKSGLRKESDIDVKQRHKEILSHTNKKKISSYDHKHGEGAYEKRLLEKLNRIYEKQTLEQGKPGKMSLLGDSMRSSKKYIEINGMRVYEGSLEYKKAKRIIDKSLKTKKEKDSIKTGKTTSKELKEKRDSMSNRGGAWFSRLIERNKRKDKKAKETQTPPKKILEDSKVIGDINRPDYSTSLGQNEAAKMSLLGGSVRSGVNKERGAGGLVGGGGLKNIENKDLPKTQIMTGPDGKPFVGHLAFKDGKPVYQRQKNDIMTGIKTFFKGRNNIEKEAALNSLEYYKKRGMSKENIAKQMTAIGQDVNKLTKKKKPPTGRSAMRQKMKKAAQRQKMKKAAQKQKKQGGGMINIFDVKENTGYDVPGATADRQFLPFRGAGGSYAGGGGIYVQPGEKLVALTKDAVDRGAHRMVERLNAIDSNSQAWKDGIKPLPTSSSQVTNLPPEFLDMRQPENTSSAGGSEVPEYDTMPPSGAAYRSQVKSYYGIA